MVSGNAKAGAGDLLNPGDPGALTRPQDDFLLLPIFGLIHKRTFKMCMKFTGYMALAAFVVGNVVMFYGFWQYLWLQMVTHLQITIPSIIALTCITVLYLTLRSRFRQWRKHPKSK